MKQTKVVRGQKLDFCWRKDVTDCVCSEPELTMAIGSTRTVTYGEDMKQTKVVRGLNSYDYTGTWEMMTSEPAVSYSSARYSFHLERITLDDTTLVIFTTVYSNDASAEVTEDQKYKLREGINFTSYVCHKGLTFLFNSSNALHFQ